MPQRRDELVNFIRRTFGAAALAVLALAGVLVALIIEHERKHADQSFDRVVGGSAVLGLTIVFGVLFILRRRLLSQAEEMSVSAAALDLRNAQLIDQADRMERQQIEKDQQAAQLQDALERLEIQKTDLQMRSTELERIVVALRTSEGRFRSLVESLHDVVYTIGLDGRYRSMYGGATRDERTLRSYIGQTPIEILGPDLGQGHMDAFDRALRGHAVTHEWALDGADGTRHFLSTMSPLRGPRGEIEGVVGVNRETTEQVRRDVALASARDQLRESQRLEALGQLAGGVAHDFNNLLTVIMTYAAILHEDARPGSDERRSVEEISDASERAAALTRQLLAFSRRQVMQPRLLDLNETLEQVRPMLQRLLTEGVELEVDLARGLGRVMADAGQIEQALINLAINARDAMPDGGRLTITTANVDLDATGDARPIEGPYVMITVSDTGVGMTSDVLAKVFDPFFTTKDVGKGAGLGLSMVHGIIEQSGGRVFVTSEPGRGATFRIYLPRVTGQSEVVPAPAGATDLGGSESVLLVDDNDELRRVVRRMLERAGYQVREAANGIAALAELDHGTPIDIVISDVIMPELGGRGVVEAVRQRHLGVRVLLMSGYNYDTALRGMAQRGDVAFIEKPFTADKLLRKLREVLEEPAGSGVA